MCIPAAGVVMEPLNEAGRGMQTERAERRSPKASQMTEGERRGARHVAPRPHAFPGLFLLWVKGCARSPPCLKPSRESGLSCVGGRCGRGILSSHGALHGCLSAERVWTWARSFERGDTVNTPQCRGGLRKSFSLVGPWFIYLFFFKRICWFRNCACGKNVRGQLKWW